MGKTAFEARRVMRDRSRKRRIRYIATLARDYHVGHAYEAPKEIAPRVQPRDRSETAPSV